MWVGRLWTQQMIHVMKLFSQILINVNTDSSQANKVHTISRELLLGMLVN